MVYADLGSGETQALGILSRVLPKMVVSNTELIVALLGLQDGRSPAALPRCCVARLGDIGNQQGNCSPKTKRST
jgi:hypothetical protein